MNYAITKGVVLIDKEDLELVRKYRWHVSSTGYAVWRGNILGRKATIRMHRLITNAPEGKIVDHINHDRLDNRRDNLRVCTQSENMRNLVDQGKGYWFHNRNKNWVVDINGRYVGVFKTEDEAKQVVAFVRSGGAYVKPVRTVCKYGHDIRGSRAYDYGKGKMCKRCQSKRSHEYYVRKTKQKVDSNDVKSSR